MFAPTTKYERISGAFALDKCNFFHLVVFVALVRRAVPSQKNVGKPTKAAANVPAESIFCMKI